MKSIILLNVLAFLASSAAAGPLNRRQGALKPVQVPPTQKAMKVESLKPQLRENAKRIRLTYGPYVLSSADGKGKDGNSKSMDPSGTAYSNIAAEDFPRDVTILWAHSEVVDENFKRAEMSQGIYNHHNLFMDVSSAPSAVFGCEDKPAEKTQPYSVFMAGATENGAIPYTTPDGKFNSGFYVGKKDMISVAIDVVNYRNTSRTVYTVTEMEFMPGQVKGSMPAFQHPVNIGMCSGFNGSNIHPPVGQKQFSLNGKGITVYKSGYLVQTRGHLHDGGLNMRLLINGKEACDSKAIYGRESAASTVVTLQNSTTCDNPIKVDKGDKLDIVANYDFEQHPERHSAHGEMAEEMALLIVTFAEST